MRKVFLTSSPSGPLDNSRYVDGLDETNGFVERLRSFWKPESRNLMITAFPDNIEASEQMTGFFRYAVEKAGLRVSAFDLLDDRWQNFTREDLLSYDVVWLGGGHVPTQNAFFKRLSLREKIKDFDGIVIGISAGTMNSADLVYSEPEEDGEAIDPNYNRWLRGLDLTKTMILPHYQMVRGKWIDGTRLYEDQVFPDSMGHSIINLPDGSYLLSEGGKETIYGEAWLIRDGVERKICEQGESLEL